jgi:glycine/D-amino acid oxidase-like deaminating enzyme/nitrite reductase/ring-hydroxylating ferredoxin subunit
MPRLHVANPSLWIADTPATDYPRLGPDEQQAVEVVVVGAGLTGLTAALLLQQDGARVALVEAGRVCAGVTAYTTGKVSSLHGLTYGSLRDTFGPETARVYGEANEAALAQVAALVEELGIDCHWERRPNYTYTTDEATLPKIEREVEAAQEAGLPAAFVTETELPFDVLGAVRFEDQAQFHARKYGLALAEAFRDGGGLIFEESRVVDVDTDAGRCTVESGGAIWGEHVVLATHLPILDRGGFFARTHPSRTYLMAFETPERAVEGMYISKGGGSSWTLRSAEGGRYLLAGGQSHKTGQEPDTPARYAAIERWAREHFGVEPAAYRWSAEDYMPVDGLPYIGKLPFGNGRVWVATGYNKWGLTNGTVAALIIADALAGRANAWAETFDANRADAGASVKEFVKENLDVAARFVGDRIEHLTGEDAAALAPGEGAVVEAGGKRVGAYRDEEGRLHAVALTCTHLGCHVTWNPAERSWDCPCHGSRFGVDGEVLHGPAVRPLERLALGPKEE